MALTAGPLSQPIVSAQGQTLGSGETGVFRYGPSSDLGLSDSEPGEERTSSTRRPKSTAQSIACATSTLTTTAPSFSSTSAPATPSTAPTPTPSVSTTPTCARRCWRSCGRIIWCGELPHSTIKRAEVTWGFANGANCLDLRFHCST
jgi:hypothetical protein